MPLNSLTVGGVRNVNGCAIKLHPSINLFIGENGSGKTSLLESIYLMFTGKSFRSHRAIHYISFGKPYCVISGQYSTVNEKIMAIGLRKMLDGKLVVKINQSNHNSALKIAKLNPVRIHSPEETLLTDASAEQSRKFLDWALFHVEHDYFDLWKRANQLVKQRNALLRSGISDYVALEAWDNQLCPLFDQIVRYRQCHIDTLQSSMQEGPFDNLVNELKVSLAFSYGWNKAKPLKQQMKDSFEKDLARGYTLLGAHRGSFKIKVEEGSAKETLSRGQKKAVTLHLKMLQSRVVGSVLDEVPIFLLDDISAELDENNLKRLFHWIFEKSRHSQIFITAIELEEVERFLSERSFQMFHVEQGDVEVKSKLVDHI